MYLCGRIPRRYARSARLDRSAGKTRSRDADPFRHHVRLAVSAFSLNRMALSRGLRAGQHSHVTGGRFRREVHNMADSGLFGSANSGERSARCNGDGRTRVFSRCDPDGRRSLPCIDGNGESTPARYSFRIEAFGQTLAAGDHHLSARLVRLNDG